MRIERHTNLPLDNLSKSSVEPKSLDSFANVMKKSQNKLQQDSLHRLMTRIDLEGQRLGNQRTLENLRDYKNSIKKFLEESLSYGLQLAEKQSYDSQGGMRTHQVVEIIDEKLLELQDELLKEEEDGVEILRIVGELKGLLINLYM